MRTLTITANNRPEYLQAALDSLSRNQNLEKYSELACFIEPGSESQRCVEICERFQQIPVYICLNATKEGVRKNPYNALNYVFKERNSDFNVYLEDDIVISPDAMDLVELYFNCYAKRYCMLSFYNYSSDINNPTGVVDSTEMVSLGMAFTRENWMNQFERLWFDDKIVQELGINGIGWDWSIRAGIIKNKWKVLMPALSRSKHIGKYSGTHCSPQEHMTRFETHPYSTSRHLNEYIIQKILGVME